MQLQTMNISYTHALKSVIDPAITSGQTLFHLKFYTRNG